MPTYLFITQKILYPVLEELKQCVYEICGDDKDIEVGLCGQQSTLWLLSYFHPIQIQNFMPDDFDLYCYVPESKLNLVKQNLYLRLTSTLESFNYHIHPFQKTPSRIATLQKCQTIFDIHVFSKPKRAFLSECFLQYHPQESGSVSKSSFFSCSFNHITTPKIQFLLGQRIPIQPLSRNEVPTFYWAAHTAIQLYNYHEKFFSTHATLDDFVNLSITQHGFNRRDKATNVQDIFSLIECFCSKKLAPTLWEFLQKPLASLYGQSLLDIVINCEEKTSQYNPISRNEAQYLACELMQDEVPFYYKLSVFFTKITHNQRLNASPNRLTIIDREQNHYFLNFNTYPVLCPIDQPPIFKNYLGMRLPNPLSQQTIFLQANEKITPSYSDRSRQKSHTKKNA